MMKRLLFALTISLCCAVAVAQPAQGGVITPLCMNQPPKGPDGPYYLGFDVADYRVWRHGVLFWEPYFVYLTALNGLHPGWARTGEQFSVYVTDLSYPSSQTPLASTCRYYGLPSAGLNSHFFTAFSEECDAVAQNWPDQWLLETSNAFRVHLPNPRVSDRHAAAVPAVQQ